MEPNTSLRNCIQLAKEFRTETNQSVRELIDGNRHIENLMGGNFVTEKEFEEEGYLHYIKQRMEANPGVLRNIDFFVFFGSKIDICILKPRHYLMLTNYICKLAKLPMINCCHDTEKCLSRRQIDAFNLNLRKM